MATYLYNDTGNYYVDSVWKTIVCEVSPHTAGLVTALHQATSTSYCEVGLAIAINYCCPFEH